ncbi:MAG: hypothetical protein ACYCQJ_15115 [Nitrososphaerales archaeon]
MRTISDLRSKRRTSQLTPHELIKLEHEVGAWTDLGAVEVGRFSLDGTQVTTLPLLHDLSQGSNTIHGKEEFLRRIDELGQALNLGPDPRKSALLKFVVLRCGQSYFGEVLCLLLVDQRVDLNEERF